MKEHAAQTWGNFKVHTQSASSSLQYPCGPEER